MMFVFILIEVMEHYSEVHVDVFFVICNYNQKCTLCYFFSCLVTLIYLMSYLFLCLSFIEEFSLSVIFLRDKMRISYLCL